MSDLEIGSETLIYADMEVGKKVELATLPGVYATKAPHAVMVSNTSGRVIWVGVQEKDPPFLTGCFVGCGEIATGRIPVDTDNLIFRPLVPPAAS